MHGIIPFLLHFSESDHFRIFSVLKYYDLLFQNSAGCNKYEILEQLLCTCLLVGHFRRRGCDWLLVLFHKANCRAACVNVGITFDFTEKLVGGAALDALGVPLPDDTLASCLESNAVLLAAIGG